MVSYWLDKPLTELTREELIEVIEYLGRELERKRDRDLERMRGVTIRSNSHYRDR
jgi:hypothetical protein